MKVTQIKDLVNSSLKEVNGSSELLKEDLSNVVDVGKEILNNDDIDNFVKKLVDRIGKTVFNSRVYQGSAPSVLMDAWEYGSVVEKIDSDLPNVEENDSWELEDGKSYDQDIFYQPKVSAKFFNSKVTFDIPMSFTKAQVESAFGSATELNSFLSMLMTKVQNAMTVNLDGLIMKTINNFTASVINAKKGMQVVNLLDMYNKNAQTKVTVDNALTSPDFIKFANLTINTYRDRLTKMSTLFNEAGLNKFTPTDNQHLVILSDLASASKVYLESDTYNQDNVKINNYDTVPYWQGSGTAYNFEDTSKIDVAIKDGTQTKEVVQTGIIGVLFDTSALGVSCQNPRTTTAVNARAEFYTNFNKYDAMYYNDLNENFVVFMIADTTQPSQG
jgi:hypothetical protein